MASDKTVGILGGMGPFATIHFFETIVKNTPAKKDWEHLRLIIDNNVKIPSRTRAVLYGEISPVPGMVDSINQLAQIGAEMVLVPCNSAHYFRPKILPQITIPWPSIIEISARRILELGLSRPVILGGYITTSQRLYSPLIHGAQYLDQAGNNLVEGMIEEIKLNSSLRMETQRAFQEKIESLAGEMDSIVLACTELPIVFQGDSLLGYPVVNTTLEYALEAIRLARANA